MNSAFLKNFCFRSIDEVDKDDPDLFEEAVAEAWLTAHMTDLPRPHASRARQWAGAVVAKAKDTLAGGHKVGDVAEEDRREAAKEEASHMSLSPFEREKVVKDIAAQGLTSERIVALSLSLHLGKVSKLSLCAHMKYGEDPALSEPAKQARKAGKRTLATILKSKSFGDAASFFADLTRNFAADGMVEESSLVANWWGETSGCFSNDKDAMFDYLEEYFEKYCGRGLPVPVDTLLLARLRQQSGGAMNGASKEEFKALKNRVADLEQAHSKVKSALAELKPGKGKPSEDEQAARRAKVVCHNCGVKGHYASECPEPKKEG